MKWANQIHGQRYTSEKLQVSMRQKAQVAISGPRKKRRAVE